MDLAVRVELDEELVGGGGDGRRQLGAAVAVDQRRHRAGAITDLAANVTA